MRAYRMLTILLLLQSRGQVTAGELAERLEVSRRTVYRDLEALAADRSSGVSRRRRSCTSMPPTSTP